MSPGSDSDPAPPAEAEARGGSRWPLWLLLALLLLALGGLGYQQREGQRLAAEAASLRVELRDARGVISAYRGQLAEVRDSVAGLRTQFERLEGLVARDVQLPPPAAPALSTPRP